MVQNIPEVNGVKDCKKQRGITYRHWLSGSVQRGLCTLNMNENIVSVCYVDKTREESMRDIGNRVIEMEITMIKRIMI